MEDPDPGSTTGALAVLLTSGSNGISGGAIAAKLIVLFVLILINAFFAMSEIAVISLNDTKIERLAEEGHKGARKIRRLTKDTSGFLSTIQIGVTLAGFLTSASAADSFAPLLTNAVAPRLPSVPVNLISTASLVLITIVISYFSLVLGELVPKKLAIAKSESISYRIAGILLAFMTVTKPFVKILSVSTNAIVRLFGVDPNAGQELVSEEEIRMLVDAGEEKGVIEDTQAEMINNIFDFDDLDAGDIMTHRVDMTAVSADLTIEEFIAQTMSDGYSRIPVYEEDQDNIVGIVYVKDLLKFIGKEVPKDKTVSSVMRRAMYVPESKKCGELFKEMGEKRTQIAVVVDEYGGTAGIVTLEDILESIVGNIQDEYDDEEDEISRVNDSTFYVDGTTDIEEVEELTGRTFPRDDYDTIAGYIIARLGYLPENGKHDVVEHDGLRLTVLSVEDRRIDKVKIEILPRQEEDTEGNEE